MATEFSLRVAKNQEKKKEITCLKSDESLI
jgi:hypothetical protein